MRAPGHPVCAVPIPKNAGCHADADHEREVGLRCFELFTNALHVGRSKRGDLAGFIVPRRIFSACRMVASNSPIQWRAIVRAVTVAYGSTVVSGLASALVGITPQTHHVGYPLLALFTSKGLILLVDIPAVCSCLTSLPMLSTDCCARIVWSVDLFFMSQ